LHDRPLKTARLAALDPGEMLGRRNGTPAYPLCQTVKSEIAVIDATP
jgi:hypothetical protein